MPTKTAGERARIEKKIKTERIVMLAVGLFAVAVFVVLGCIFGGFGDYRSIEPEETPEPTEDPKAIAALALKGAVGGSLVEGEDFISLTYSSPIDGNDPAVKLYLKSGVVCMQITRRVNIEIVDESPAPTDMFGDPFGTQTAEPDEEPDRVALASSIAEETVSCLSVLSEPRNAGAFSAEIADALIALFSGESKGKTLIFGVYTVKLSFSEDDSLLIVICEPV